jgi:hypothetical protein
VPQGDTKGVDLVSRPSDRDITVAEVKTILRNGWDDHIADFAGFSEDEINLLLRWCGLEGDVSPENIAAFVGRGEAITWIQEFAHKMSDQHPGFVHIERRARAAHNDIPFLLARTDDLEAVLRGLLEWAVSADYQLHSEWGVGPYEEDPVIHTARAALKASA